MRTLAIIFCYLFLGGLSAQTAANWSVNDCSGTNRELFKDLDAGKVVVMIWVMPCATCINDALEAQTEVQNALSANPGKVVFYVADDYANTNCNTLSAWCSNNGITDGILISNALVNMNSYGTAGMPKVIVVGGTDHKVYYNENAPAISANGIRNAITTALAVSTGFNKNFSDDLSALIAPNPASQNVKILLTNTGDSNISVEFVDQLGQVVRTAQYRMTPGGPAEITIETSDLAVGTYFVKLSDGDKIFMKKLVVIND